LEEQHAQLLGIDHLYALIESIKTQRDLIALCRNGPRPELIRLRAFALRSNAA
jgi:hypothetical protein